MALWGTRRRQRVVLDESPRMRRWCLDLPPIEAVPDLTGDELLRCMQWEAPAPVLGMFPG